MNRIRQLNKPILPHIKKAIVPFATTIENAYRTLGPDLQSINAYRYARQITGGTQEYMEAVLFQHYLETQTLLSFDAAASQLSSLLESKSEDAKPEDAKPDDERAGNGQDGEKEDEPMSNAGGVPLPKSPPRQQAQAQALLTPYDYILGLFDMTGEVMRFAITSMATNAFLPSASITTDPSSAGSAQRPRTTLIDLQLIRMRLEVLNYDHKSDYRFAKDAETKLKVTQTSVEKVEKALYGLVVRGSERPQGWVPDMREGGGGEEVEAY